jgi:hypothetical protein
MNTDTKILDLELVDLYVDEYDNHAQGIIPDLQAGMFCEIIGSPSDSEMRDALSDCIGDHICDSETIRYNGNHQPEFGAAAKKIAERYFGKPENE